MVASEKVEMKEKKYFFLLLLFFFSCQRGENHKILTKMFLSLIGNYAKIDSQLEPPVVRYGGIGGCLC